MHDLLLYGCDASRIAALEHSRYSFRKLEVDLFEQHAVSYHIDCDLVIKISEYIKVDIYISVDLDYVFYRICRSGHAG